MSVLRIPFESHPRVRRTHDQVLCSMFYRRGTYLGSAISSFWSKISRPRLMEPVCGRHACVQASLYWLLTPTRDRAVGVGVGF